MKFFFATLLFAAQVVQVTSLETVALEKRQSNRTPSSTNPSNGNRGQPRGGRFGNQGGCVSNRQWRGTGGTSGGCVCCAPCGNGFPGGTPSGPFFGGPMPSPSPRPPTAPVANPLPIFDPTAPPCDPTLPGTPCSGDDLMTGAGSGFPPYTMNRQSLTTATTATNSTKTKRSHRFSGTKPSGRNNCPVCPCGYL